MDKNNANGFQGIIDGNNHNIYGLNVSGDGNSAALGGIICNLNGGVIKNLRIADGTVSGSSSMTNVGAFAGTMKNKALISHCVNQAAVKANTTNGQAGGIVGSATGSANTCVLYQNENRGSITGAKAGYILFGNGTSGAKVAYLYQNKNGGSVQTQVA